MGMDGRRLFPRVFVGALVFLVVSGSAASARPYRFVDVAAEVGLSTDPTRSWGSTAVDYDRDGDIDLFMNRHARQPHLYTNVDGRFTETAREFFSGEERMDRHGCSWGEANLDGLPDLYCTQGADKGFGTGPNKLYIQTGATFEEAAREYGVANPKGRGRTANWLDFDRDRDLDLFVGNEYRTPYRNRLFVREGERFQSRRLGLNSALRTKSSSWSDWDRDGDPDMLVLQRASKYPQNGVAYRNDRGRFRRVKLHGSISRNWNAAAWGDFDGDGWTDLHLVGNRRSLVLQNRRGRFKKVDSRYLGSAQMSVWFDAENDGDLDLYIVRGRVGGRNARDVLMVNKGGRFGRVPGQGTSGEAVGFGDAVSVGDLTGDGRQDLFVSNGGSDAGVGAPNLLENRTRSGNYVSVQLIGGAKNPLGLGTRVRASSGSLNYWREVTDGYSYRSQSDPSIVHLGIRKRPWVRVVVDWPGRPRDCVRLTPGSHRVVIGSSPCGGP